MNRDRLGPHKSWTILYSVVQGREVVRLFVTETYLLARRVVMYQGNREENRIRVKRIKCWTMIFSVVKGRLVPL